MHWHEKDYALSTYSCLLFIQFPLFDFSSTKAGFSFSTLHFIIHFIGTAIVKNRCYVFLASMLNSLCFIGNAFSVTSNSCHQAHLEPSERSMMKLLVKVGNRF